MQNDITDAVQWAIDKGIADPKRIAIFGGSMVGMQRLQELHSPLNCIPAQSM